MKIITSKYATMVTSVISFALCFFPLLSARVTESEGYTFIIRGFTLAEHNAMSIMMFLAPILIAVITLGCQSKKAKEAELILLMTANSICFVLGISSCTSWLTDIGATSLRTLPVSILYLPVFILTCLAAILSNAKNSD